MTHRRILLLATTTGYQTRSFGDAAERLGIEVALATDRCTTLEDPWRDRAMPIRFDDEPGSVAAILDEAARSPFAGLLAVGDRPVAIAAQAAAALGLPYHSIESARAAHNKRLARERLVAAGLPVPWFACYAIDDSRPPGAGEVLFPCVIKPLVLSGSRGVIRANTPAELHAAHARLAALLHSREVQALRDPDAGAVLIEGYIPGEEYAIEGLLEHGHLRVLAIFDKPDPLHGPFFEETIYVTPSRGDAVRQRRIEHAVASAAAALGLRHGPIHAECRVDGDRVFVLEVAARPIGGLCARALWFENGGLQIPLEELLLRHALGEPSASWAREAEASGVMMVPIPHGGVFRRVDGLAAARTVHHVTEIHITAKADQRLVPLPEGASYLGFIFARAQDPGTVEDALRGAHARLDFVIDRALTVVSPSRLPTGGGGCVARQTPNLLPSRHVEDLMSPCSPPSASPSQDSSSGRRVFCQKFQKEMPGLDAPPWPGELGQRIYENISLDAWRLWEERMKMILNEYRLMPWQKEAQELVAKHMEDFFFGEGAALPPGYVPEQAK